MFPSNSLMCGSSSSRGQKSAFKSTFTPEHTTALTCGSPYNRLLQLKMIASTLVRTVRSCFSSDYNYFKTLLQMQGQSGLMQTWSTEFAC